jgi:hypothetical protein
MCTSMHTYSINVHTTLYFQNASHDGQSEVVVGSAGDCQKHRRRLRTEAASGGQTIKTCLSKSFMLSQMEKDLMLYKILGVIYKSSQVNERKAMGQHYDNTYNDFTYNDKAYNTYLK